MIVAGSREEEELERNSGDQKRSGEAIGEIASILARGYLRLVKSRRGGSVGMYANRFLSDDEKKIFEKIIAQLYQDFVFNKSSDFMQVELVAVYFIKLSRAQEEGNWDAAERLDRMIRCHLKDLKTTKITRETDPASKRAATPAEWASKLVKTLADEKKDGKDKPAKKRKRKKDGG